MIDLADEMSEDGELGRHFRPADDGSNRPRRIAERTLERLELRLHGTARVAWQEMRDTFGRRMRPVRNGEAVVDVMIAERRHRLGELGIVLFLTGVKAGVFEHANVAWQHRRNGALC